MDEQWADFFFFCWIFKMSPTAAWWWAVRCSLAACRDVLGVLGPAVLLRHRNGRFSVWGLSRRLNLKIIHHDEFVGVLKTRILRHSSSKAPVWSISSSHWRAVKLRSLLLGPHVGQSRGSHQTTSPSPRVLASARFCAVILVNCAGSRSKKTKRTEFQRPGASGSSVNEVKLSHRGTFQCYKLAVLWLTKANKEFIHCHTSSHRWSSFEMIQALLSNVWPCSHSKKKSERHRGAQCRGKTTSAFISTGFRCFFTGSPDSVWQLFKFVI